PHQTVHVERVYAANVDDNQGGLRQGDLKFVRTRKWGDRMFDLGNDLDEQQDLSSSRLDDFDAMRTQYEAWLDTHADPPWGWVEGIQLDERDIVGVDAVRAAWENRPTPEATGQAVQ
ncbi:MAG: hypothetical protein AAFY08_15335, partial [Planctomycetota bacterium]